jgi:hypothetical protein
MILPGRIMGTRLPYPGQVVVRRNPLEFEPLFLKIELFPVLPKPFIQLVGLVMG